MKKVNVIWYKQFESGREEVLEEEYEIPATFYSLNLVTKEMLLGAIYTVIEQRHPDVSYDYLNAEIVAYGIYEVVNESGEELITYSPSDDFRAEFKDYETAEEVVAEYAGNKEWQVWTNEGIKFLDYKTFFRQYQLTGPVKER